MRLIVGPIYTEVEGDFIEIQTLDGLLTAPDGDGNHQPLFINNRFYTGLLSRVEEIMLSREIEYTLDWTYDPQHRMPRDIDIPLNFLPGIELRPHQISSAQKLIAAGGRGIVNMGTGGGKSETGCVVTKYLNKKTLVLSDRINAMEQFATRFRKYGIDCGRLGGGFREIDNQVVSAVVDSLYTGLCHGDQDIRWLLGQTEYLLFDEVHHLSSMSWNSIGENCLATARSGLSASAFSDPEDRYFNDMLLIGHTGEVVCHIPPRWLIDRKYLAEPLIHWVAINTERIRSQTWHTVYKEGVVQNNYLNYLVAGVARHVRNLGYKVLILVQRLDHGKRLLQLIDDPTVVFSFGGGGRYRWVDGQAVEDSQSPEDLRQSFEMQSSGILVGSTVYDEAIDIPSMNFLIMAGGGKSFRKTVQRLGRPLHSRDEFVHVLDFWFYNHPYLQKHSRERAHIYSLPGYEYRMFSGLDELNRRLTIPIDPQRILFDYHRQATKFTGEIPERENSFPQ